MTHIKDVESDAVKLCLFPFSLRGKAKEWLLTMPKGTITSCNTCCSMIVTKYFSPDKTMQLGANFTGFR